MKHLNSGGPAPPPPEIWLPRCLRREIKIEIRPKAVFPAVFSNSDKCRPEVADDVILREAAE